MSPLLAVTFSPVVTGVLTVLGVAIAATAGLYVAVTSKINSIVDAKIKNDALRQGVDLVLHLVENSVQAALTTGAADLSAGNPAKAVVDVVSQVKGILVAQGGDAAKAVLSMGNAYLSNLVTAAFAKLSPAPAPATSAVPAAAPTTAPATIPA